MASEPERGEPTITSALPTNPARRRCGAHRAILPVAVAGVLAGVFVLAGLALRPGTAGTEALMLLVLIVLTIVPAALLNLTGLTRQVARSITDHDQPPAPGRRPPPTRGPHPAGANE